MFRASGENNEHPGWQRSPHMASILRHTSEERGTDMRQSTRSHRLSFAGVFVVLACVLAGPLASRAWADDPRIEAKAHYQAGVKMYSSGDYRGAIKEFTAAQALAPADLNNYNLALCYDKLGEAEPAIQYYRADLDKAPNTD